MNGRTLRGAVVGLTLLPSAFAFSLWKTPHAAAAAALPNCYDPVLRPNVVYGGGGDLLLLGAVAKLVGTGGSPVTFVLQAQRSCTALSLLNTHTALTGAAQYLDPTTGLPVDCQLSAGGDQSDVAFSDSFAETCGITVASDVGDFYGPISPQVFVVPSASSQKAISAEAAYVAFGVYDGSAKPWIDKSFFWVRDETSGTQQVISAAIGIPADHWWGAKAQGSSKIVPGLQAVAAADADKAIGTLPAENAQGADVKSSLRVLAFQAKGQIAAFWPDSTEQARDKQNVRDGHYAIWGPLHLFARLSGAQPSVKAAPIVARFAGSPLDKQIIDAAIDNFFVPHCAMRVRRTTEMGPLSAFTPDVGCGCYFDSRATGQTTCTACKADSECPASTPRCNYGYCEVK